MLILLTGGSGNGKSTFARTLLSRLPHPRFLVDTALVYDEEEARDRSLRREQLKREGIETLPRITAPEDLQLPQGSSVILECMCHLTANELFSGHSSFDPEGDSEAVFGRILEKIRLLRETCENLIVVTNEVSCEGIPYDSCTAAYQKMLGRLNGEIAAWADCVCEVVCGIPRVIRGSLPGSSRETGSRRMLVVGPEYSGKRAYLESLGYREEDMSRDPRDGCPVLLDLQDLIHKYPDPVKTLLPLLETKTVIVCNEVGSGIIPVSRELTRARVDTGTLCCILARQADRVVRVICGIPSLIK